MDPNKYSMGCYGVVPKGHRIVLDESSGIIPETISAFKVLNIGRESVYAVGKYGTAFGWLGDIVGATIKPGEEKILGTLYRPYYRTGIYLENYDVINRALVCCDHRYGSFVGLDHDDWKPKMNINDVAKKLVTFGVSKIPEVGPFLSAIVGFFWPNTEQPSVWEQIESQVKDLVDKKTNEAIRGILGGDLRYLKERIAVLELDLEKHPDDAAAHYMNIAEDLIGFEKKFAFTVQDNPNFGEINYFILPMYSNLVTLKLTFYAFGIVNHDKIGLTDDHVQRLKEYSERLVNDSKGAIHHVTEVLLESVLKELNTCNPNRVFSAVAIVRTYCALSGTEYIAYWKDLLMHPGAKKKPYIDALCYSTGFGRPTPKQATQIIPIELEQPLTPKLIDEKRNKIEEVDVWTWRMKISGIKVYFENGDTYEMGRRSIEEQKIQFEGAYCTKLSAWGNGALDFLEFTLSDGRVFSSGTKEQSRGIHHDFQLENHHIAGIFLANDAESILGDQPANIAVSYQLTPEQ